MGTTAKLKAFKAPPRNLPREIFAFKRKVLDTHEQLKILSSGTITPGVKRMAERLRLKREADYAALVPIKNRLEDESGTYFNYDTGLYDLVIADIFEKTEISGCPILLVCNSDFSSLYKGNKVPYCAHYQSSPHPGVRPGITIYPELYLSDAEASKCNSVNPAYLFEAYSMRYDATDIIHLMPGENPPKVKLALAISDMMSERYGVPVAILADQKIHCSVVHELAHFFHVRASGGSLGLEAMGEQDARFTVLSSEMLASAAELVYGINPRASLGSFLAGELLPKPRQEARQIINYFNHEILGRNSKDMQEMLPAYLGVTAEEIRKIAREILDSVSKSLLGKPWSEVADESGFEEAKKLVFEEQFTGKLP